MDNFTFRIRFDNSDGDSEDGFNPSNLMSEQDITVDRQQLIAIYRAFGMGLRRSALEFKETLNDNEKDGLDRMYKAVGTVANLMLERYITAKIQENQGGKNES